MQCQRYLFFEGFEAVSSAPAQPGYYPAPGQAPAQNYGQPAHGGYPPAAQPATYIPPQCKLTY